MLDYFIRYITRQGLPVAVAGRFFCVHRPPLTTAERRRFPVARGWNQYRAAKEAT